MACCLHYERISEIDLWWRTGVEQITHMIVVIAVFIIDGRLQL